MGAREVGLLALLLAPAVAAYASGQAAVAHYLALGTVLAFNLGVLARPLAPFAILVPVVYAAAAITAQVSDGVAALIVAVAVAVGAASSQGFHRGLLSVLAAVLVGSFEASTSGEVMFRATTMLVGCTYGYVLVVTAARSLDVPIRAVHSQTAISYGVLVAVITLIAWFAARLAGFPHGWWLPLAVAAIGEPYLAGTAQRSVTRAALALAVTVPLLAVIDSMVDPASRAMLVVAFAVLLFTAGRQSLTLQSFLFTPVIMLLTSHQPAYQDGFQYLSSTLTACAVAFLFAVLSKWLLWTLRPDPGHAAV